MAVLRSLFLIPFMMGSLSYAQDSILIFSVYFDMDRYQLETHHKDTIDAWMHDLDLKPHHRVEIEGFTDFVGTSSYNQILSENRSRSVYEYVTRQYKEAVGEVLYLGSGEYDSLSTADPSIGIPRHRMVRIRIQKSQGPSTGGNQRAGGQTVSPDAILDAFPLTGVSYLLSDSLQPGQRIILDNLNFYPGRHYLLKESIPYLKELLQILLNNPGIHVQIQGHICCGIAGEPDAFDQDTGEQKLSYNRARNIYQYLVRNGIDEDRLSYTGFGYANPLFFPERNQEEKKQNRRVEIMITKINE